MLEMVEKSTQLRLREGADTDKSTDQDDCR